MKKFNILQVGCAICLIILQLFLMPVFSEARTGTPRIYLTSSVMAKLQAKAAVNDPTWLNLKARADVLATYAVPVYDRNAWPNNSIIYAYQGESWLDATEVLGLAWKVTGTAKYADKLIQLADVMIAAPIECIQNDSYYPTRAVPTAAALIYDWLYDYPALNQNGRKAALIAKVNTWFDLYKVSAYEKDGPALSNYFGGHLLGFGLAGIAMDDDNTRGDGVKLLPYMKSKWDATVGVDFVPGGDFSGGWPNQGFNYGPSHFSRLMKFAFAYKSFTEVNTGSGVDLVSGLSDNMALHHIYNLMPNRWQATDEGDWPTTYRGIMSGELPTIFTTMLSGTLGDQMAFFANNLAVNPSGSIAGGGLFTDALFKDSTRTKTDYRNIQPLNYRSVPDQHVYVRSDWTDNAVWSSYNGGSLNWSDHQIRAAGHIALARGSDYLLVNASQWKGITGVTGTPDVDQQMGDGTNTLFWDDGAAYNYNTGVYVGGQGYWGINTNLKYEAGTGYTYSKSDHTSAYDISTGAQNDTNRTLRYYHRNYVNLGGTTVVLYDRIQAKVASYTKEMRFHLHKQSTNSNSGGIIQSTVGSSRVFIKPISPTGTLTLDTSNIASALPRVRVIPPTAVTDWNPLTVIATGSSSASMPTTTAIDTTAMSGVVVSEVIPKIIMFSKSGTQQNAVTYTASYTAGTTGNHLLVDMEPGMYDIYRDGGKIISGAVASGQGVLSFSMTGGTLFQAVKTGTVPIETTAPVVTGFALPASATSLTVEISAFTASDANGVAGYLITESAATPSAAVATGWKTSAPTTFTFSGTGARTAYAWAKDAAGNVSKSVSATVTITLPPDLIAPAVTSFTMPSTASSLTVSVSSFTATDDTAVSGYIITENASPPQASAAGWSTTAPASFTFAGYGSGTAYAWAKDFAGNVSSSVSANCLIEPAFAFIAVAEGAVAKGSGTTLSTSSTLNVLAGDLLVAAVHWEEGTGGTIGVTDGSSNVFTMTPEVNSSGQAWAAFGYKISASANAAATFKFTNSSAAVYRHLYVYQFRPAPGATVSLDPTTTNPAIGSGNSASPVGGTITTKGTDTVVIGSVKSYSDTSHSAHKIGGVAADGSTSDGLWSSIWYRLLSSPMASGYAQATLSYATTWVCGTIGFKASSGTPSPPTGLKPIIVK